MRLAGKRILLVITKSNWGGAQAYVYTLACAWKKLGAEVDVAFGGTGERGARAGLLAARLDESGIKTHFIPSFMRNARPLHDVAALKELYALYKKERPDVVHLNSSKAGGVGALAARLARVPRIVFTAHGWADQEARNPFAHLLIRIASYATMLLSHEVIVLSEHDARRAPAWLMRKKLRVIHNGIAPLPLVARDEARRMLAAPDAPARPFWFLTIGELTKNKNTAGLIEAFLRAKNALPEAALVIIGDGEEREALLARAAESPHKNDIVFAGFVPDAQTLLQAADVFVLASEKEGLPFVLLEAGAAGLPVIATRVGAVPGLIESGAEGLLIEAHDDAALASALQTFYKDASLREKTGNALRGRVTREFSQERMLAQTLAAYR
jgi:glycosyltransferase involved in cell wall biosynthesis